MPSLTKEKLIEKIEEYGETPPPVWSKNQLEGRLAELKAQYGKSASTLRQTMHSSLNKAAKNKPTLQMYLQEQGLKLTGNETMAQLLAIGQKNIQENTSPRGQDYMGFGKHSQLTYQEAAADVGYMNWAVTTYHESGGAHGTSDWRLKRFVQWCQNRDTKPMSGPLSVCKVKTRTSPKPTSQKAAQSSGETTDSSFQMVGQNQNKQETESEEMQSDNEIKIQELEDQLRDLRRHKKEKKGYVSSTVQENRKTKAWTSSKIHLLNPWVTHK